MDPTDWQYEYTHQRRRRTDSRDLSGKVDMYSVSNTLPFRNTGEKDVGFPSSTKWSSAYNINRPLKERVNEIMQRRLPDGQWRKATTAFSTPTDHLPPPNPVEKTSLSTLNKDDHPLKLRVKALMKRHRNSGLLHSHGEVPVKPQPPSQSPTTTVEEKNSGKRHFGSSRRSMSPPVVEEKKPKLEQHQGDLQNILKTIGFSMDADDMCKLAERTQKRLYGMKNETELRSDATALSKRSQQHVRSDHSRSSSSTSVSDRPIPMNSDAASAIPSYTSVRHSEYSAYHSDTSNCASLNYGSSDIPPSSSSYPPAFCNYSMTPLCPSADTGALDSHVYPHPVNKTVYRFPSDQFTGEKQAGVERTPSNADLSLSEGQTGQQSAVNTVTKAEQKEGQLESQSTFSWLNEQLKYVRKQTETLNCNSKCNSNGLQKQLQYILKRLEESSYILSEGQTGQQSAVNTVTKAEFQMEEKKIAEKKEGQKESYISIQRLVMEIDYIRCLLPVGIDQGYTLLKDELECVRIALANCDLPKHNPEWLRKQLAAKEQYILMILNPNADLSLSEGQTGQKWTEMAVNTVTKSEQKEGQIGSQRSIQGQQLEGDSGCPDYIPHIHSYTPGLLPVGKVGPFFWLKEQLKYVRKETETQVKCNHRGSGYTLWGSQFRRNSEWLRKQLAAKEQYILKILRTQTCQQLEVD